MSDNKLVKTVIDAATRTRLASAGPQKGCEREFHFRSQQQLYELHEIHRRHGGQHCAQKYLEDQKILPNSV